MNLLVWQHQDKPLCRVLVLALLFASIAAAAPCSLSSSQVNSQSQTSASTSSFVEVCGTQFAKDGELLRIVGWNTYRLADAEIEDCGVESFMADIGTRLCFNAGLQSSTVLMKLSELDKVPITRMERQFEQASSMGLNTVRMWTWSNRYPLQVKPGVYDEVAFRAMDRVLAEARYYNMNVMLCFVNNWEGAGSVEEYLAWNNTEAMTEDEGHLAFFTDASMKQMVKDHMKAIIMRRNTVTGELYRDDTSIMAWNLINEPRCKTEPSYIGQAALQDWIKEMASYVKTLDANHLLSVGEEGFFSEGSPFIADNPSTWSSRSGQDFVMNHNLPEIDFAAFHIWPSHWKADDWFMINWIAAHIEAANLMQKPVIIEEFGVEVLEKTREQDLQDREDVFKEVYNTAEVYMAAGSPIGGTLFWMYEVESPGETDTYGILPTDTEIFELVRQHAQTIKGIR
eukprot:jgi/Tetstr1/426775/TSEL_016991.t1